MKSFFSGLTTLALRFRAVTLALAVLVSITGVIAITQLKQELIPSVEFPQTIILAQAGGMTSDQVLNVLRSMASWVQQRDDNYVPPFVRGMRRTPLQDRKRARVLNDDELRRVWRAASS